MPFAITPNPGGDIPPALVLGRDEFIRQCRQILETRSIVLASERRLGKTCVMKKMAAEWTNGMTAVYCDLEHISTPEELAETLEQRTKDFRSLPKKALTTVRKIFRELHGTKITGVELPAGHLPVWKERLTTLFADLATVSDYRHTRLVLLLDEVPFMLQRITKQPNGQQHIEDILAMLRYVRQQFCSTLRMVYTGSIGLHHILSAEQRSKLLNDMSPIQLPPLTRGNARELAQCLIGGIIEKSHDDVSFATMTDTADTLATEADCVPYYMHHIADHFVRNGGIVSPQTVRDVVERKIHDPECGWQLAHFRERLGEYYPDRTDRRVAVSVLNACASAPGPCSMDDIQQALLADPEMSDIHAHPLDPIMQKLILDHYLVEKSSAYTFRFTLIQRWWMSTMKAYA